MFALEEAEAGDGSALLRPYDDIAGRNAHGSYTNELEASDAVNCLDRPAADGHARSSAGARRPAHVGDRDHPRSSHPVHPAVRPARQLPGALLTYDGDGHTAHQRSGCITRRSMLT